ncbi:NAD(P)H-hydrate dehydratase [Tabrizicola oligotrophica]|uniref:Bifunctional NAD(P)H-hydrate repair enzyme n=1 Tax=Tabrizicola oligotrophica TaxID=2710650 RepID=A0A6M0QR04_9RHOB|nr:NAD(P)H-hydrate dehydratase [Tabrizicola oligotrophica]NEY88822.1 NAD(P)H-hydrate dehydratase [Tabrizicola oligotrophica]
MTELLTAAQMRAIEQAAIASGEVTGLELMERAGRGVVEAVFEEWPELRATSHRAVVLCGPGNNGGDGFVVARLLKEWGWEVEVFLYGDPEKLPPDARVNYERWVGMGEVTALAVLNAVVDARGGKVADLIVDAFFGIGLARSVPEDVGCAHYNLFMGYLCGPVVAVDLPSGLCSQSGRPLEPDGYRTEKRAVAPWPALDGYVAEAGLTVTFHGLKPGHLLEDGPRHCGKVVVVDIGLKGNGNAPLKLTTCHTERLGKRRDTHKFSHGHALIVSGTHGRSGAARLAARGALRIGAGLVTLASPPGAMAENAARLDAIMLREVARGEALTEILQDARINALCLGPGMGTGEREAEMLAAALGRPPPSHIPPPPTPPHKGEGRRLVLDADALTILSQRPELFAALHGSCILTPHAGEFARLFPDIAERLNAPATTGPAYSKLDATREAAARAGCVVLFKGPDTVIADPSGRAAINAAVYDRAAPWLATAGSGDVLAGFLTGLLARGFAPFDAACTGAWLHVECARSFGPGLIAEDLPEELPKVFRALGL